MGNLGTGPFIALTTIVGPKRGEQYAPGDRIEMGVLSEHQAEVLERERRILHVSDVGARHFKPGATFEHALCKLQTERRGRGP